MLVAGPVAQSGYVDTHSSTVTNESTAEARLAMLPLTAVAATAYCVPGTSPASWQVEVVGDACGGLLQLLVTHAPAGSVGHSSSW